MPEASDTRDSMLAKLLSTTSEADIPLQRHVVCLGAVIDLSTKSSATQAVLAWVRQVLDPMPLSERWA